eukprot:897932-Pleurochrysis_carterae.AAC.5
MRLRRMRLRQHQAGARRQCRADEAALALSGARRGRRQRRRERWADEACERGQAATMRKEAKMHVRRQRELYNRNDPPPPFVAFILQSREYSYSTCSEHLIGSNLSQGGACKLHAQSSNFS